MAPAARTPACPLGAAAMFVFAVTQFLFLGAVFSSLNFAELVQGRHRPVSDKFVSTEDIRSFSMTAAEEATHSLFLGDVLLPLHFAGLVQVRLRPGSASFADKEYFWTFPMTAVED